VHARLKKDDIKNVRFYCLFQNFIIWQQTYRTRVPNVWC